MPSPRRRSNTADQLLFFQLGSSCHCWRSAELKSRLRQGTIGKRICQPASGARLGLLPEIAWTREFKVVSHWPIKQDTADRGIVRNHSPIAALPKLPVACYHPRTFTTRGSGSCGMRDQDRPFRLSLGCWSVRLSLHAHEQQCASHE